MLIAFLRAYSLVQPSKEIFFLLLRGSYWIFIGHTHDPLIGIVALLLWMIEIICNCFMLISGYSTNRRLGDIVKQKLFIALIMDE